MTSGAADLQDMRKSVASIGDINRRKDIIDKHSDILKDRVVDALKDRDLPDFYMIEDSLVLGEKVKMEDILECLDKGTPQDKLRLLIIHYLCKGEGEEHAELLNAASRYEVNFEALNWVKTQMQQKNRWSKGNTLEDPKLLDVLMKNVNAVNVFKRENTSKCDEEYAYESVAGNNQLPPNFTEAIVFLWGGGSYLEFQNLQDWKEKDASNIASYTALRICL